MSHSAVYPVWWINVSSEVNESEGSKKDPPVTPRVYFLETPVTFRNRMEVCFYEDLDTDRDPNPGLGCILLTRRFTS